MEQKEMSIFLQHIVRYFFVLCSSVFLLLNGSAHAQQYPSRAIRIIVGPGPDVLSRIIGQRFTDAWGQQAIVDPRPGAGGTISAEMAAKAAPDGYTLLMATSAYTINSVLQPGPTDMVKDFAAIGFCATSPYFLLVHPSVPVQSVKELTALAHSKPGGITYASSGNGTGPHLAAEMYKLMAGINMLHVPYKGAAPSMVDLVAGHIQVNFQIASGALSHIQSGKVRALAVTRLKRSQLAPEVPTMDESGFPEYEVIGWNGLVAPATTPRTIVGRINMELMRVLKEPITVQRIVDTGWEPAQDNSPEWFASYINRDIAKWRDLVRKTGMKVD